MKKFLRRMLPLVAALVLVVGSCLTVRASDSAFDGVSAIPDSVLADYPYYIMYTRTGSSFVWVTLTDSPVYAKLSTTSNIGYDLYTSGGSSQLTKWKFIYYSSNGWERSSSSGYYGGELLLSTDVVVDYVFSHDVYDDSGNLVFRRPSLTLAQVTAGTVKAETVQKEILWLIPLLIPCLVGYLGLRKALQFLLSILQRA